MNMKLTKRKKAMILGALVLILCLTVVNNQLQTKSNMTASTEYVNYEKEQIEEHNGDVLVDSLNISSLPGASIETISSEKTEGENEENMDQHTVYIDEESQIVTSDDYAELSNADVYYDEARATLNMDRNNIVGMLTEVIAQAPDGQEKNNATNQKLKIIDYMNKEKNIESLIKAKGYEDALVVITDSAVTITVKKNDLSQSDVAKICDIVIRETGRNANQIVIQSKA